MSAYGFTGGHRMALNHRAEPLAHEITIRYRAQSMLTRNGVVPEPPSFEEAQRIIARSQKPRIHLQVTVPEPLRQPAPPAGPSLASETPFRAPGAVQAPGANLPASPDACSRVQVGAGRRSPPTPSVDDDAGWADYQRRAFAGDFEPF